MSKILITGGSQGIGLAIARKFHGMGWDVTISARNAERLAKLEKEMPGLQTYPHDLMLKEEVLKLAETYLNDKGAPDILVNNAGMFKPGEINSEPDEFFEDMMALNLNSAYYLTKRLIPALREKGSGYIVNMCSVASIKAYPNGACYAISKHALLGFSRALREEMIQFGIRVTAILAGATWTPSWEGAGFEAERMMPAEDIANTIASFSDLSQRTVPEEILIRPFEGDV